MCRRPAASFIGCLLAFAGPALLPAAAAAQSAETVFFDVETPVVHEMLSDACRRRGMAIVAGGTRTLVCGQRVSGEESSLQGLQAQRTFEARFDQHMQRFDLAADGGHVRVAASGWVELLDAGGNAHREDLTSFDYRSDLQVMLDMLAAEHGAARLAELPLGRWQQHHDEEGEWRLDAHRRAVARCDEDLPALDADALERNLAAAGVQPFSTDLRGRCEALYEAVYLWALARGADRPDVAGYVEFVRDSRR